MSSQLGLSVEDRFHTELFGLPRDQQKKVLRAIADLRRDPAHLSKPLEGLPGIWRRRVDTYRILFTKAPGWLHVYSVQHRQGVYHGQIATPQTVPDVWNLDLSAVNAPSVTDARVAEDESASSPEIGSQCWDVVWKVVDCHSDDDLLALIDFGAPDLIVDRLSAELQSRRDAKPTGQIQLVRRNVIDAFFGRLFLLGESQRPTELVIAAPWLTAWNSPKSSLDGLIRYLKRRPIRTTILTRPPDMASHESALARLAEVPSVQLIQVPALHAKFFICDVAPVPFALVASANTTAQSFLNWEVGVLVRGSGELESFIRDLQALAIDLIATGKLKKRRSAR